jgi:rRNA maturation endonuclease Nob1
MSTWKILPVSQKPLTSKDLTVRCVKCPTKIKSGWKFCPQCGTETSTLDMTEDFLKSLSKEDLVKMLIEK